MGIRQPKSGHGFVLFKSSTQDGLVRLLPLSKFSELNWSNYEILTFPQERGRRTLLSSSTSYRRASGGWNAIPRLLRTLSSVSKRASDASRESAASFSVSNAVSNLR